MRCLKMWTCVVHLTLLCLFLDRVNAAPALTTIQDTLYKADGTRFNGVANIEWSSFQASDGSSVAASSVVVPIVDGVLRVRLVPTSNASAGAHYFVRYQADGRVQFIESWNVIPSAMPVTLSMIRTASGSVGGTTTPPPTLTVPDITGLAEELANRPVKGFSYSTDRILKSGPTGALESVQGTLTDCIHVDGTSGPCGSGGSGSGGPGFVDQEVPAGAVNGSNTVFTLNQAPTPASSLQLYRNGVLMKPSVDYTLASTTVTFGSASAPQTGDLLLASYRLATVAGLSADSPATEITAGVIGNLNVAAAAGIVESKLALNFPTHSNANDPSAREKAALSGTAGTASATNKYVTDQDARLSNARPAQGHFFLGVEHTDTTPDSVVRGDLITGSFATGSAKWTRLPLGPANRCLVSNGSDAVWNTCLFTGFHVGTIPFTGADGALVEAPLSFVWDNSNRHLSVGSNLGTSTLSVHDGGASGTTMLTVRAGQGQGTNVLQSWQNSAGLEQASIGADGVVAAKSIETVSTSARPAWREAGASSDPSVRSDGDAWFNATELSRKTVEGGKTHTTPQVLCAAAGTTTTSTTIASLGTCTIPAGMANPGDRLAIRASWIHDGTAAYSVRWRWGSTATGLLTTPGGINVVNQKGEVAPYDAGAVLESCSDFIGITTQTASAGITVGFEGNVTSGGDNLRLVQFTVIRYPAQSNP